MARPEHTPIAGRRARDLRLKLTVSEARVWSAIKAGQVGARFRRQVPIGHWIADFASLDPPLVIEIDDTSHEYRDEERRTAEIEAEGFTILRFTNREIALEFVEAIGTIENWVEHMKRTGNAPPYFLPQRTE